MHKPNVHLFHLYQEYYFYDVNTNAIVKISKELYKYLNGELYEKSSGHLSENAEKGLDYLKSKGLLAECNTQSTIHFETNLLENLYQSNLSTLTLQVTQNCNLRCKYCVYSGSYVNRIHTNKRMDWRTAKKAIDFLYQHSKCSSNVAFGFYGGEPLLEYELIKKCVSYIKQMFDGKKQTFVLTTNATLLNEEIVQFFVEHDFSLMISLDGPEHVQDGNRVFADNRRGTFQVVMDKLKMIENTAPEYIEKINFNAVIDLNQDFEAANEFFLTFDMVKNTFVRGTFVNEVNKKEKSSINYQYMLDSRYEEFRTMLFFCTNLFKKYQPRLLRGYIDGLKQNFVDRDIVKSSSMQKTTIGGQCLPGIQRLFVTAEGKLYPCERVNEKSEDFCIGSLEEGFDIGRAQKLLNVGQLTAKECQKCWCSKICSQCISKADDNGRLSKEQRLANCGMARASAEKLIKDYIILKKYNCRFHDAEAEI